MASEKTPNLQNLTALGADRLAGLLLELAAGDAAIKRKLRLELAGSDGAATAVRKRLATIAKSKSFIDWNKVRAFAKDLETQHAAIMKHVAPTQPAEAFDLLWRFLEMAPSIYERCDDSNGDINTIMDNVLDDLGVVAKTVKLPTGPLVERVYASVCADSYGQFSGLIGQVAGALGRSGLVQLKAKFEASTKTSPAKPADGRHRSALTEIADALGDVDSYAVRFSEAEQAHPATAANIAARLLAAGRAEEAMTAIQRAEKTSRYWPDWDRVRIEVLEALGRAAEAQQARRAIFERDLDAAYLKEYLKRLPDFEDVEAEERALAHARAFPDFDQALAFLVNWPAHTVAAAHILERHDELDGDSYWLLTPAADALEQRYPLAATLMLRAMILFALEKARAKRYGHAARHLKTCDHLARRIKNWNRHPDHAGWVAELKRQHARKTAFWEEVQKPKNLVKP